MVIVRPDERRPLDFDFTGQMPDDEQIQSLQRHVYAISDNAKTDVSTTVVDAAAVSGKKVRLALHQMTLGRVYHVEVRAVTVSNNLYKQIKMVSCQKYGIVQEVLPLGGKRKYVIDFSDVLPENVAIDADASDFSAYLDSNLSSDIIETLMAGVEANGRKMGLVLENGEKDATYLVHVLAASDEDDLFDTDVTYLAGMTLLVRCKEL